MSPRTRSAASAILAGALLAVAGCSSPDLNEISTVDADAATCEELLSGEATAKLTGGVTEAEPVDFFGVPACRARASDGLARQLVVLRVPASVWLPRMGGQASVVREVGVGFEDLEDEARARDLAIRAETGNLDDDETCELSTVLLQAFDGGSPENTFWAGPVGSSDFQAQACSNGQFSMITLVNTPSIDVDVAAAQTRAALAELHPGELTP